MTTAGRTWGYRELADLIADAQRDVPAAVRGPIPVTGMPLIQSLAVVFAAAAADRAVLVADPATPTPALGPLPREAFLIAVTSGTSGRPRPVVRTAGSWTRSFAPLTRLTGVGPDDRVLLTGPLHATLHLFAAVHTLAIGAELTDRADRATALHAVPAVLADLLTTLPPDAPLRTAIVAGSAVTDDIGRQSLDRNISLVEYYGAAELSFVAARRFPEPLRPFPGTEVELRDGTLWVRSPYLAIGYPPGTTGPFRRDARGFGTVGDLAEDTEGSGLLIRGRGDATISTGGATVIAEDVEAALGHLPGVAAVAVVGVPHARLGQVVTAVVEPVAGADLRGLRAAARLVLGREFLPRRWLLAERLPRTPSGKIARHPVALAAARAAAGRPPDGASPRLRPLP